PIGKNVPEGGVQLIVPQLPEPPGVVKFATAPHCPAVFWTVMSDGQLIVHSCCVTLAEAVEVLSLFDISLVELETAAVRETSAPSATPALTSKTNWKTAVTLAGRVATVQVDVPVPPEGGLAQVKPGPELCVSEENVE